jgi:hypothetical protein
MSYPYLSDQLLQNPEEMPSKENAITLAKNFLTQGSLLSDDLANGEQKVSYWEINYDGLQSVDALSQANIIRVDFYRKNLEGKWEIISPQIGEASVSVLVSGNEDKEKQIIEASFKYADIDRESFSTYPIKTAEEAIEDLKAGNYWPVSDVTATQVTIRNMYLAYFEPVSLTNYLQPIFVFEGDNNFVAYVPAIPSK